MGADTFSLTRHTGVIFMARNREGQGVRQMKQWRPLQLLKYLFVYSANAELTARHFIIT